MQPVFPALTGRFLPGGLKWYSFHLQVVHKGWILKLGKIIIIVCIQSVSYFIYVMLSSKESTCSLEDLGLILGSRRSPGEGKGNPLQYSSLGNPMDRGAWRATVHGVTKESDVAHQQRQRQSVLAWTQIHGIKFLCIFLLTLFSLLFICSWEASKMFLVLRARIRILLWLKNSNECNKVVSKRKMY